jgi:hypothetical protein
MRAMTVLMLGLLLFLPGAAFAGRPIENLADVPIPAKADGTPRTREEVRMAILQGCSAKGWTGADDGEQKIRASILVRGKHYVEVSIPYTTQLYSILYLSSRNMDYDEKKQTIHRKYAAWVGNLSAAIQREFGPT